MQNKTKQPKVSIITVCLNSAKTIERTIKSVLNQTYSNIEYIIIDGGSKDETLNIIKKYEHKITKWISEPDKGLYDAMNKGIKKATGEIIGILNSDDIYELDTLQNIVTAFQKSPEIGVVYGDMIIISNWEPKVYFKAKHRFILEKGIMIPHPTCFIKKTIYNKYGLFDDKLKVAADYDFLLRIYKQQVKFLYLNKVLARFSMGGNSQTKVCFDNIKTFFRYLNKPQAIINTTRSLFYWLPLSIVKAWLNKKKNNKIKKILWKIRYPTIKIRS